ncbi:MAG: 4Fe-4S ferredoxin [Candidatus Margulisbacteria bacterium GWF2_38_17]|nr:MAG: 4Fe-4S ferredoxin [Candidatus Margulisbacteria bacterium GWF2_38_17]
MAISEVWIVDGCISCGACEAAAPEVFVVPELAEIKSGVDFNQHEGEIKEAAESCPVNVIHYK